jgi:hypothetical protein
MALRGTTFPVLAMKVTAGSVGLAEGVLARYTVGVQRLGLVDLYAVAAIGGDEWSRPAGMVIGHFLHARAARTLFTPASPEAELTGWTTAPTPATSTPIATTLLYGLGGAIANAVGPPPTAQQRRKRRASR